MSPHAVRPEDLPAGATYSSSTDLSKFCVTRNAFLPEDQPCQHLADPYYEPWEAVAQHLPRLIQTDGIRDAVSRMPVLSTDSLRTEEEWRRAYLLLAYMTQAYVWGGEKPEDVCCTYPIGYPARQGVLLVKEEGTEMSD
jgi:indoleamine 2,3-dioxygenase